MRTRSLGLPKIIPGLGRAIPVNWKIGTDEFCGTVDEETRLAALRKALLVWEEKKSHYEQAGNSLYRRPTRDWRQDIRNSKGVVLPKPFLAQVGLDGQATATISL